MERPNPRDGRDPEYRGHGMQNQQKHFENNYESEEQNGRNMRPGGRGNADGRVSRSTCLKLYLNIMV